MDLRKSNNKDEDLSSQGAKEVKSKFNLAKNNDEPEKTLDMSQKKEEPKMKVNLSKTKDPQSQTVKNEQAPTQIGSEKKKSKSPIFMILGISAIVIVVFALYFFIKPNGKESVSITQDSTKIATPSTNLDKEVKKSDSVKALKPQAVGQIEPIIQKINGKIPSSFPKGSSIVNVSDNSIIENLLKLINIDQNKKIIVYGYASSEGTVEVNQKLSQERAESLKKYLISKGIPSEKIDAIGKGTTEPIASNDSEEGKAKNRRVEIQIK